VPSNIRKADGLASGLRRPRDEDGGVDRRDAPIVENHDRVSITIYQHLVFSLGGDFGALVVVRRVRCTDSVVWADPNLRRAAAVQCSAPSLAISALVATFFGRPVGRPLEGASRRQDNGSGKDRNERFHRWHHAAVIVGDVRG